MGFVIVSTALMALGYAARALIAAQVLTVEAREVETLTHASRGLLRTILPLRLERGSSLALGGEAPADPVTLSTIAKSRQAVSENFRQAQVFLRDLDTPSVTATLGRLEAAHADMAALRPGIDAALQRPKAQRDPALQPAMMTAFQNLLDALTASLKAVDAAIPRSDPVLQRYLDLKGAAWATRVASGNVALRVQASLASGTVWSLPETVAAAEERGELHNAWSRAAEAASDASETSDRVRTAFQRADAENFGAETAAVARAVFDALSQNKPLPVTFAELRDRNTANQRSLVTEAV